MPRYPDYDAEGECIPGDKLLFWQNASSACKTIDFQLFATSVVNNANLQFPFIYVDNYGAVGDGVTDDTVAIINAITAAGENGVVVFGSGKTYLTTIAISVPNDNVTLLGYNTVITSQNETQFEKFIFEDRTSGRVSGFVFNMEYASGATGFSPGVIGIYDSSNIVVDNCTFNECGHAGIVISGDCARILITQNSFFTCFLGIFIDDDALTHNPTDCIIVNNEFRDGIGGTGTAFSGAIKISGLGSATTRAGHVISGNSINSPGQMGIEIQTWINDCTISNNTIVGAGYGISISGCQRVNVSGNVIKDSAVYGIECASTSAYITLSNNTISSSGSIIDLMLVVDCNNVNFSGSVLQGGNNSLKLQTSSKCVFNSNVVDGPSGNAIDIIGSTDINITGNEFNCTGFDFIFVDSSTVAVARILIEANIFRGTVTNNGITLYAPNAPTITDIMVVGNNTSAMSCPGGAFSTNSTASPATKLLGIRSTGNIGTGTGGNENQTSFSQGFFETSSSMTGYWDYMGHEGGILAIDATGGIRTVELPPAARLSGYRLTIIKTDASGNAVTVDGNGAETINGIATASLAARWDKVTVSASGSQVTGGAQWVIVS